MKLIPLLVILMIITRVGFCFAIKGKHSEQYLDDCFYVHDSALFTIMGLFLCDLVKKQRDYCQTIIKYGIWFCFTLPVLLLSYAYLPDSISVFLVNVIYGYFAVWALIVACLIVYYIFCIRGDLL